MHKNKVFKFKSNNDTILFKDIKLQTNIVIVSIFVTVITVIGSSYAAFVWNNSGNTQQITAGNYIIQIDDTSSGLGGTINLSSAYPMTNASGEENSPYKFTIKNNSNTDVEFKLKLNDNGSNTLNRNYIKISLSGGNTLRSNILGSLPDNMLDSGILPAKGSKSYQLKLWITEDVPNSIIGKTFSGKLSLETKQVEQEGNMYQKGDVNMNGVIDYHDTRIMNEYLLGLTLSQQQKQIGDVTGDGTIYSDDINALTSTLSNTLLYKIFYGESLKSNPNFSDPSKDKGLYIQIQNGIKSELGFPTYYYRGNVDNNYVQFGTYKTNGGGNTIGQPIIWRIIRINEDGSIKLISQNNIDSRTYWDSINNNIKYSSSGLKSNLDSWYRSNIGSYPLLDSMVITSNFCDNTKTYFNNPTFICLQDSDITNSKVGLITADEAAYSGSTYMNTSNTYLDNGTSSWTITSSSNVTKYVISSGGAVADGHISQSLSISTRAVINLRPDVNVTTGTGKSGSPFVIATN